MIIRLSRFILLGLIGVLLCTAIFSKRGLLDWKRIASQNSELKEKIAFLRKQKESLEKKIETLQTDPVEQERVVRQTLGYVKKNEAIIEFE